MNDRLVFLKANCEDTLPLELDELSNSTSIEILCSVALNTSTPEETLQRLKARNIPDVLDCLRIRGIV